VLGPSGRANLNHWNEVSSFEGTQQNRSPSSHMRTETDPVSETLCFLVFIIPDDGQIPQSHLF
jgi:hypothetical protein